jgi:hypothetical protein
MIAMIKSERIMQIFYYLFFSSTAGQWYSAQECDPEIIGTGCP